MAHIAAHIFLLIFTSSYIQVAYTHYISQCDRDRFALHIYIQLARWQVLKRSLARLTDWAAVFLFAFNWPLFMHSPCAHSQHAYYTVWADFYMRRRVVWCVLFVAAPRLRPRRSHTVRDALSHTQEIVVWFCLYIYPNSVHDTQFPSRSFRTFYGCLRQKRMNEASRIRRHRRRRTSKQVNRDMPTNAVAM